MTAIPLSTDATVSPEDASDLFGHPPRKSCPCPACGMRSEPYYGEFCWLCVATGDAGRKLAHPTTNEAERDRWSGLKDDIKAGRARLETQPMGGI